MLLYLLPLILHSFIFGEVSGEEGAQRGSSIESEMDSYDISSMFSEVRACMGPHWYEKAIKLYEDTINSQGSQEEIWHAKFMIGNIYNITGEWENALSQYLDAYQYYPVRAEPLEKISKYYRENKQNNLAYLFASQGKKISYPTNQEFFVDDEVYNYRFDEDLSIASYYTPFREEGLKASDRLLFNRKTPPHIKYNTEKNLRFYVQSLPNLRLKSLPIKPPLIREGSQLRCNPMNPSILKTDDGYTVICRCVNYTQEKALYYRLIDPNAGDKGVVKARNFLLQYDKNFSLLSQKEIIDEISQSMKCPPYTSVQDVEDCRVFEYKNALWATGTVWDMDIYHMPKIGLYKLGDSSSNSKQVFMEYFIPLEGPVPGLCEKNWLPFIKDEKIHVIYGYDPLTVYSIEPETGCRTQVLQHEQTNNFSNFRGSAGPVPFDDGYLVVIHQVVFDDGRHYFHRFLYLDEDYNIKSVSQPFTYKGSRVEYCCGMTIDHSGSTLIMTVGIEDREAILAFIDLASIRSLLSFPEKDVYFQNVNYK